MPVPNVPQRQIRACFDRDSIVIYQAYEDRIADAVLRAGRFVEPFSFRRMTWIKPSFLWLMSRSNWGAKSGQHRTLAVRISRTGWEEALGQGVLTAYHPNIHREYASWEEDFGSAKVHIQWDPERSVRGEHLQHDSIQVGLSRHVIRTFAEQWVLGIEDLTSTVDKIRSARDRGRHKDVRRHLPKESVYPLSAELGRPLGIGVR